MTMLPTFSDSDRAKYLQALALAARPLGTEPSTKARSETFEDICVEFEFPRPRQQNLHEVIIDENLPNIFIGTVNEEYLTLARCLAKTKLCNTVIMLKTTDYNINPVTGNFETVLGAVYHDQEIVLAKFSKPLSCHYFLSNFTEEKRIDPIERGKVCSNSIPAIHDILQDKMVIKKILINHEISTAPYLDCEKFLHLNDTEITQRLHAFCVKNSCTEFVVKPTNTDGGNGVCFFTKETALTAAHYIKGLLLSGVQVIVEKRIFSLPFYTNGIQQDWNIRVFITRDADNHFIVGDMIVRADNNGKPVNLGVSARVMLLDDVLTQSGVQKNDQTELHKIIDEVCIRGTMHVINDLLKDHPAPHYLQQDWMGVDIMVSKENDKYIPYIIELNNEDSGGMWAYDKLLQTTKSKHESSCLAYAQTIIRRATAKKNTKE